MESQQISVDQQTVGIVLANGTCLEGQIFLPLCGISQAKPCRVEEVLNGTELFVPFTIDRQVRLINLAQIQQIRVAASAELDPLRCLGFEHNVRVFPEIGDPVSAKIYVNLPNEKSRTKDFLNQHKRFLPFLVGEQVVYIASGRIAKVEG
jgi:hypothetical protein